jgi:3-hydroxyisobutyrate dehydrogenase
MMEVQDMSAKFTVGFVGIGMMGVPMATCLAAAGWPVRVYDVRPEALAPFAGREGTSPADVVAGAALVITMLPNGRIVRDAVLGQGGLAAAMVSGTVLADMSTSYPLETTALAAELEGTGNWAS